jgi:hypothetical protein
MNRERKGEVDPFTLDPPPCPYAAEGKCPLAKEAARGLGHISLINLGDCGECPGHNAFDLWGGPYFAGRPVSR